MCNKLICTNYAQGKSWTLLWVSLQIQIPAEKCHQLMLQNKILKNHKSILPLQGHICDKNIYIHVLLILIINIYVWIR